jgi:hypothetical protein
MGERSWECYREIEEGASEIGPVRPLNFGYCRPRRLTDLPIVLHSFPSSSGYQMTGSSLRADVQTLVFSCAE